MSNSPIDAVDKSLLKEISDMDGTPTGAYNIRKNGKGVERQVTENINIVTKTDKPGIDIFVKENTKNEFVHIPVIILKVVLMMWFIMIFILVKMLKFI